MRYILVDPDSVLNWENDWADGWLTTGDTIASRQWSISPLNGTSPETPSLVNATSNIVFTSGLRRGKIYYLTEHVVTASGLQDDRTIVLRADST